jgi:hypothetical protein
MPKTKISEFSSTPANNTDIDSINIAEGCAPSGINDAIRELMAQLKDFQVGSAGDPVTVGGVLTVQAGSASTPALTTAGDTNTGIFFPAADTIAFAEGGVEAMRLDSSGKLLLGTTNATTNLTIGNGGGGNDLGVLLSRGATTNFYQAYDGTKTYIGGADASNDYIKIGSLSSHPVGFVTGNSERMRLDTSGNWILGGTSANGRARIVGAASTDSILNLETSTNNYASGIQLNALNANGASYNYISSKYGSTENWYIGGNGVDQTLVLKTSGTERARIDSSGNLLVGKTTTSFSTAGGALYSTGQAQFTTNSNEVLDINRLTTDGKLIRFFQDSTEEGNISVSGTTVSYNGGHLSRWAQTTTAKDESLVKGTVLSNLDAMNIYTDAEGNPVQNEQLNKVKVSDAEGDVNVAGVFVNWTHDDAHDVDEINMAMTGDMIIRIAQGTTVQRGDLLMSAGNGTAKPQGDDIVRSKTIAKVTSNHVTCTYADGSYCVPCVLMAC